MKKFLASVLTLVLVSISTAALAAVPANLGISKQDIVRTETYVHTREPENLSVAKQELIRYHDSGQYEKDIEKVIREAKRYLKSRIAHPAHNGKKPAIVLDIDETSLSNYPDMVKMNFGGTLDQIREAEKKGNDPAIKPTLRLYELAKEHGVAVFFITGRYEHERAATEENLKKTGYRNWDGLILRSEEYKHKSSSAFKSSVRKKLTEENYEILLNVGDQQSDLNGGYAEKAIKLPNPFYFIP